MPRRSKPADERVINAGISLPPKFVDELRDAAKIEGYETLTGLARYLLTQWLQETYHRWEMRDLNQETARERLKSSHRTRIAQKT